MTGDTPGLAGQLLLGGAFVVTQLLALRLTERAGLDVRTTFWATVLCAAAALIAGPLCTAIGSLAWNGSAQAIILTGERGVFGALAAAAGTCLLWLVVTRRPLLEYTDAMVPAVFVGYAVARLACFVDGHCFGVITDLPIGTSYPPESAAYAAQLAAGSIEPGAAQSQPVHPAQLYHALAGLFGFFLLIRIRSAKPGARTALALMAYGSARFVIEFFRGDAMPVLGPLDVNQLFCLGLIVAGVSLWWLRAAHQRKTDNMESSEPFPLAGRRAEAG